ncbi:MAG: signal peptidase I [Candidatus Diapherotrites archaeon]|nr:signal peptidase I [Candidatus Diapherotrites archaeon]
MAPQKQQRNWLDYSNWETQHWVVALLVLIAVCIGSLSVALGTPRFLVTIVSGSMEPALYRGDLLVMQKTNEYKAGDILVFERGNDIIVHRAVRETPSGFQTKGDHNPSVDLGFVTADRIYGKSILILPKIGNLNLFLAGR